MNLNSFRPSALKIDTKLNPPEVENLVYNTEFTNGFHFFISIASACLAWILFLKPTMDLKSLLNVGLIIFWTVIFPIVILSTDTLTDSIMSRFESNTIFIYIKFISIWLFSLLLIGLLTYKKMRTSYMTALVGFLTILNIMEASVDQIINRKDDKTDIPNGVLGILIGLVFMYFIYKKGVNIKNNVVHCGLGLGLLLAYTFWNLQFRGYLLQNTGTLYFFVTSLLLPLVANYFIPGSWIHMRVFSLLFYVLTILGFGKDDSRLIPIYNEQGYIEEPDKTSFLSYVQKEDWYRFSLTAVGLLCLLWSVFNGS